MITIEKAYEKFYKLLEQIDNSDISLSSHRPGGCADPAYDGGPLPRHRPGDTAAAGGYPHPAPLRAEEVQGQDELCRQAVHPLCDLPG